MEIEERGSVKKIDRHKTKKHILSSYVFLAIAHFDCTIEYLYEATF